LEQEKKLIRAIVKRGSGKAADTLIRMYYDEIYRFMYRQVGNMEDAMDLTQDCFIAVLKSLPSYDEKKAGFRTWLYRIAMNKVIDMRRKNHPIVVPLDEEQLPEKEDIAEHIADQELLRRIEEWVCGLDSELQKIYRLHIYAGESFPQIAETLGEKEEKIKARYYRLMKRLRREFQI
jgi:RNA polymerase sigma-70 factor (ECF subfamily)